MKHTHKPATNPGNVGAKSVRPEVRLRGKPCSLKRHFKGCLRQIVGYLDLLAARDPERFVWCSAESIQRHSRRWKAGGTYSRSQVFFWLHEAERLGVLTSAMRTRHGIQRKGFVVASHDALLPGLSGTVRDNLGCVLQFKPDSDKGQTGLQNSQTGLENGQTGLPTGLNSQSDRTPNRTPNRTEKTHQIAEPESDSPDSDAVLDEDLDEERRPLALVTQSVSPVKRALELEPTKIENENPKELVQTKTPPPLLTSPFDDLTDKGKNQTRGQGGADRTIGDEISLDYAIGAEVIEIVSDGLFDTDTLANYLSTDELVESCIEARREMSDQPFLGRKSYAAVMGRAMQILRAKYHIDAPRGWLPVMRQLRASAGILETGHGANPDRSEIDPSQVLTPGESSIHAVSYQDAEKLESERQNNPLLSVVLIDTAKRLGIPKGWVAGLRYTTATVAELRRQDQPVPDSLAAIHAKLKERVTEMVEIEADLAAGKIKPPPGARWEELPASVAEEANLALMESELPEEPAAVAEVSQLRGVL